VLNAFGVAKHAAEVQEGGKGFSVWSEEEDTGWRDDVEGCGCECESFVWRQCGDAEDELIEYEDREEVADGGKEDACSGLRGDGRGRKGKYLTRSQTRTMDEESDYGISLLAMNATKRVHPQPNAHSCSNTYPLYAMETK